MIFTPEIISIYIVNILFAIFSTVVFIVSIQISLKWDSSKVTTQQYTLEKRGYLAATIIKFILFIKIPLFLFFIFTIDKISGLLIGAMCGAGVIDATPYGINLMILKIINIYLFGFWLILHNVDINNPTQPYTKMKFNIFLAVYILLIGEIILETAMFSSLDPSVMVSCCGSLYSSTSATYISTIINMDTTILLGIFYINLFVLIVLYYFKNYYIYSIFSVMFIIISILSLIAFFGTYIYELPTHHCPFCLLQKDYYYVGYLLYSILFLGTFFGMVSPFFKKVKLLKYSIFFIGLYTLIVTLYPVIYFIRNGVWL
jgi:hypothetical protein